MQKDGGRLFEEGMMPTKIEWSDESWNPVTGCARVSPGCKNCYAECMARRLAGRFGYPEAPNHFDVTLRHNRLDAPLEWRKPRKVFVCSMSDWLHPDIPFSYAALMFLVMSQNRQHTYQLLTKRAERLGAFFHWAIGGDGTPLFEWPLPNVWLGVSVENSDYLWRIEELLKVPAAVRFVSLEPLLGPISDLRYGCADNSCYICKGLGWWVPVGGGRIAVTCQCVKWPDWVIVGGESGPGARPMHPDWARDVRDQCQAAGVPYFHKQNGAWIPCTQNEIFLALHPTMKNVDGLWMKRIGKKRAGRLLDDRLWEEYPS